MELFELGIRLEQRLLQDVLGVFRIAGDVQGQAVDVAVVLLDQRREGFAAACVRRGEQRRLVFQMSGHPRLVRRHSMESTAVRRFWVRKPQGLRVRRSG